MALQAENFFVVGIDRDDLFAVGQQILRDLVAGARRIVTGADDGDPFGGEQLCDGV